jgi:hypothetical protein
MISHLQPNPCRIAGANCPQQRQRLKEQIMKKERRWLKSAIAASAETQVVMPWARGQRRRPEAMKDAPVAAKPRAIAAR